MGMVIPALHHTDQHIAARLMPRWRLAVPALAGVLTAALVPTGAASQEATYGPVSGPVVSEQPGVLPAGLPPALGELADRALSENPQAIASRAALAVSQADLDAARWLRYPSLSAEALAATGGSNAADIDGFAVNVALEQPIWAGGTINNRIDAARAQRDAGAEGLREARFNILAGIIEAWFGVVRAEQRAVALEAGIADHRALVGSIERRVAAEVSPQADLTLAQSRTTQLEIELASVREAGANALVRLGELAGEVPQPPVLPAPDVFSAVPPEPIAFDEMIGCAPTLARLRNQIASAEADVRGAKGALLPQLLLQLSQNELTGARAALVLRAQTGNGLTRFSAIDRAEARVDQTMAQMAGIDRELRARLANEYVSLRSNRAQAEAGAQASAAAAELQASYQRQFVAGRRSWLDVMNAAREVTSARIGESDAQVNAAANATRILALSCRWRPAGL
jgi:outer membrane protein, adhesin transport system